MLDSIMFPVPSMQVPPLNDSLARNQHPLPDGPVEAIPFDDFGPLLTMSYGLKCVMLIMDRFSRRATKYSLSASEFSALTKILANGNIPRWRYRNSFLTDYGCHFCYKFSRAVCDIIEIWKLITSAHHTMGDGGTQRVNHSIAQVLSLIENERQDD